MRPNTRFDFKFASLANVVVPAKFLMACAGVLQINFHTKGFTLLAPTLNDSREFQPAAKKMKKKRKMGDVLQPERMQ